MSFMFATLDGLIQSSTYITGQKVYETKEIAKTLFGIDPLRSIRLISIHTTKEFTNDDEDFVVEINEMIHVIVEEGIEMKKWQRPSHLYETKIRGTVRNPVESILLHKSQPKVMLLEGVVTNHVHVYHVVDGALLFDCCPFVSSHHRQHLAFAVSSKYAAVVIEETSNAQRMRNVNILKIFIYNIANEVTSMWDLHRQIHVVVEFNLEKSNCNFSGCFLSGDGETVGILLSSTKLDNSSHVQTIRAYDVSTGTQKYTIEQEEIPTINDTWTCRTLFSSSVIAHARFDGVIHIYDINTGVLNTSHNLSSKAAYEGGMRLNVEGTQITIIENKKTMHSWEIHDDGLVFLGEVEILDRDDIDTIEPQFRSVRRLKTEIWHQRKPIIVFPMNGSLHKGCLYFVMSENKKTAAYVFIDEDGKQSLCYCTL